MAFAVPAMPLTANYWRGSDTFNPSVGPIPPDGSFNCQLGPSIYNSEQAIFTMKCAWGTDIRDSYVDGSVNDLFEIPAGSGIWFTCIAVFPIASGFPNHHMGAFIQRTSNQNSTQQYPTPPLSW